MRDAKEVKFVEVGIGIGFGFRSSRKFDICTFSCFKGVKTHTHTELRFVVYV